MTTTLEIEGMSCAHCVRAVTGALEAVAGVEDARVDLDKGWAEVVHDPSTPVGELLAAVEEEGYSARKA